MKLTEKFDYAKMEQEARRESEALQGRLAQRRREPPAHCLQGSLKRQTHCKKYVVTAVTEVELWQI